MPGSKLLVLQDNLDNKLIHLLDSMDYQVSSYSESQELLVALRNSSHRTCVIINMRSDVNSGLKVQERALELKIASPFVFILREGESSWTASAVRQKAIHVVEQPLTRDALRVVLDQAFLSCGAYKAYVDAESHRKRLESLSERERRIVQLASDGMPNKRIATVLGLSVKTVEKQRRQAYQRLNVTSTAEMTRAVTLGNLQPILRGQPDMPDAALVVGNG